MALDEAVAERIRGMLRRRRGIAEKRMFGGVAFLSHGNMFLGVVGKVLMARVGPEAYEGTLGRRHVREMDFTGKPLKGYVYVDPPGFASDKDLGRWVSACLAFAKSLPPKKPRAAPRRKRH